MRNLILLTFLTLFFSSHQIYGQCARSGSFVAADPSVYPISGDANITFMTDGSKMVNFESNFTTVQGLNLHVFLSPSASYDSSTALQISTQPLQDDNGGQNTGDAITGVKSFTVPSGVELGDYDHVLVVCTSINALWGHATLGANVGADCATLSTVEFDVTSISIFPNPAVESFSISNNQKYNLDIEIFNVLGKQVFKQTTNKENLIEIDLNSFHSGVYVVKVTNDSRSITQKLIVR